jgi:hypothetical protein
MFGEGAFSDFGYSLGMAAYQFDPLRGEMKIYKMDEYYLFMTDDSIGCEIAEIEDVIANPRMRWR